MPDDTSLSATLQAESVSRDLALRPRYAVFAVAAGFAALLGASILQDIALLTGALSDRIWVFDVNTEQSMYTWASSLLIGLNGVLLALMAIADRTRRFAWAALAIFFLIGSSDEVVTLHEHLSGFLTGNGMVVDHAAFHFAWVVPGLIFVALFGLAFARFLLSLPRQTAIWFVAAGAVFVGGAIGMEMLAGILFDGVENTEQLGFRVLANLEEGMEGAGQIIFLAALLGLFAKMAPSWRLRLS